MLLVWLVACQGMRVYPPPAVEQTPPAPSFQLTPASADFGMPPAGDLAYQVVKLLNTGEGDLVLEGLDVPEGLGLAVETSGMPFIGPGGEEDLVITWIPEAAQYLQAEVVLDLVGQDGASVLATLPVLGSGAGPVITLSSDSYDFGEVNIGCTGRFSLTLINTGNEDLELESVHLEGDGAFEMAVLDLDIPGVLRPFESREIDLAFSPDERYETTALLELEAGDTVAMASFTGTGVVDGEEHLVFEVEGKSRTTVLFHAHYAATSMGQFEDALPTFFQTRQDNHVTYRVAFLWNTDGDVEGSRAYIDESVSPSKATTQAMDMLDGNLINNDQSLRTLLAGISANEDWLFEDEGWARSKLGLVGLNNDDDTSGGAWTTYVAQARAYKEDSDDVVFHAIGGGTGCGQPYYNFRDAVAATGGVFGSFCDSDWSDHMAQIAAGTMGGAPFFQLEGHPLASSIEVVVDGLPMGAGWWYDEELNAVVFSDAAYPMVGTTVEIRYLHSADCW